MRQTFTLLVIVCLVIACPAGVGQIKGSVHGNVFREPAMGLTYEFPGKFSPKVESEIPSRDPTGRDPML